MPIGLTVLSFFAALFIYFIFLHYFVLRYSLHAINYITYVFTLMSFDYSRQDTNISVTPESSLVLPSCQQLPPGNHLLTSITIYIFH